MFPDNDSSFIRSTIDLSFFAGLLSVLHWYLPPLWNSIYMVLLVCFIIYKNHSFCSIPHKWLIDIATMLVFSLLPPVSLMSFCISGALLTAGVLTAGLISFRQGNSQLGQKLMRARVVVQGATVALMVGTAYYYGEKF